MSVPADHASKRVLFVDDEPRLLAGLESMLYRFRTVWDMAFASDVESALALVKAKPFDVVVSDIRVAGTSGLDLLAIIKELAPGTTRIILSSEADREAVLRAVGIAHQFLAKPCSAEELKGTIQRSLALRELLGSERVARVAGRLHSLPVRPALHLEIQRVLAKPTSSIDEIGKLVEQDVGLSAKLLQLVNSAFFGLARSVASAAEATRYLGLDTLNALVFCTHVFEHSKTVAAERLGLLWNHSLRTATVARALIRLEGGTSREADQGFLAGMLHEVGLLLLLNDCEEAVAEAWKYARRFGLSPSEGERRVIGASHATVGAYLMGTWGLPDPVVQAIAFHHTPGAVQHQGFGSLAAVHVATAFDCGPDGCAFGETERELDHAYLEAQGLVARLGSWRAEYSRLLSQEANA